MVGGRGPSPAPASPHGPAPESRLVCSAFREWGGLPARMGSAGTLAARAVPGWVLAPGWEERCAVGSPPLPIMNHRGLPPPQESPNTTHDERRTPPADARLRRAVLPTAVAAVAVHADPADGELSSVIESGGGD